MSEITPEPNEKLTFSRFDQNLAFGVMLLACAAVTFIKLDDLIGAAVIDLLAEWYGIISVILFLVLIIFLMIRWNMFNTELILIAIGTVLILLLPDLAMMLFIFILPFIVFSIPVILIPILSCLILLIWAVVENYSLNILSSVIKKLTVFVLISAVIYLIGNISLHTNYEKITELNVLNHHYLLHLRGAYWDQPDRFFLYECNQYAFQCREIYRSGPEPYFYHPRYEGQQQPIVDLQFEKETVRLYVDNELWFEHQPSES